VTIVPFPAPPVGTPASGEIVTAAVDRYLDSIKTKTTHFSYAGTLARPRLPRRRPRHRLAPSRGLRRGDGPMGRRGGPPPGTGTCPR
jgi:hypothetical protein